VPTIDSSPAEFETSHRGLRHGAPPPSRPVALPFTRMHAGALAATPGASADTLFGDRLGPRDARAAAWEARLREFLRRGEFADGSRHIALVDPAGLWGAAIVKTLAAASGAAVRRLDAPAGAVLGLALPNRGGTALHVCHATTPPPAAHPGDAALAVARQSELSVVIVGPLGPEQVDTLLTACLHAARQTAWKCPRLLFLLPHGAAWIANKIAALRWPAHLHVEHDDAELSSAMAAWNRVLLAWETAPQPHLQTPEALSALAESVAQAATVQRARDCLVEMLQIDGMLACAVVDASTGTVLARENREDHPVDLDLAAASSAQALRAHRLSAQAMGFAGGQLDELTLRVGHRVMLLRMSPAHAELFLLVLLEGRLADAPAAAGSA